MIIGIGNDIVEIKRFMTLKEHFKDKFYTEREIEEAKGRASFFAANFSVRKLFLSHLEQVSEALAEKI